MRRGRLDDRGETLVELIVALAILSIAGVAILVGFQFSILSSDVGRRQSTSDSVLRSLAEKIQNWVAAGHYTPCASATAYLNGTTMAGMPSGYTSPTATAAQIWTGTAWSSTCTSSTDLGVQLVTLTVTTQASGQHQVSEHLTVIVRKPCSNPAATAASPSAMPC